MSHLCQVERDEIAILLNKKYTYGEIGMALGRNKSVIRREVRRNTVKGQYISKKAQLKAYQRRRMCKKPLKKIRTNDSCEEYIRTQLTLYRRSPEQIAATWNSINPEYTITHTIIYQYIYSRFGYDLTEFLYSQRKKPRKRKPSLPKNHIKQRILIDLRPTIIGLCRQYGHYEVDLIVSPTYGSGQVLLTLVDKIVIIAAIKVTYSRSGYTG